MQVVARYVLPAGTPVPAVAATVGEILLREGRVDLNAEAVVMVGGFYASHPAGDGQIQMVTVPTVAIYDFVDWLLTTEPGDVP